ncbi:MAG TPA: S8 family serine peptidase [Vicinamibacterales bacterium]|nr:S8 family serine peptidase [Vicinamibacterales bacterium]
MTRLKSAGVCVTALGLLFAPGTTGDARAQGAQEHIVQFRAGTPAAVRRAAAANAGATARFVYAGTPAATVRVPNEQALAALRRNAAVVSIVPNRPVFASQRSGPNGKPAGAGGGGGTTSGQVTPAGVKRVGAPVAGSDGSGVGVAILDTGIDLTHPDLAGTVNAFTTFGSSCQDDEGHGTHVAGIVAARNNGIGVVGVAPGATLYCVKVLDQTGSGSDATLMAGLDWVLDNHASVTPPIRVINMSLGRPGTADDNPAMRDLIASLDAAGVSVVVAAGNDAESEVTEQIPAAYPQVISVASTTALGGSNQCRWLAGPIAPDTASYFTTDGPGVTVSAPGEEREDVSRSCVIKSTGILSTSLGGGTIRMSGTSMAAPHVAGIAARHYQQYSGSTAQDVRFDITQAAVRKGVAPLDSAAVGYTFDGVREGVATAP